MIIAKKKLGRITIKRYDNRVYVLDSNENVIKKFAFAKDEKFAIEYHEETKSFKVKHGMVERNIVEEYDLSGNKITNVERVKLKEKIW